MPSQHYVERACSALLRVQGTARCLSRSTTQCATRALFYRSFTLYKSSASHQSSTHGKRTEGSSSSSPIASASGKKVSELLQQLNERRQLHHSHSQQRSFTAMDDLFKPREQSDTHASTSSSTPITTSTAFVAGAHQAQSTTATQPPRRTLSLADMPALSLADCFDADEPEETQKKRKTMPLETDVDAMGLELPDTLYGMEEWSHVEDVMRSEENIEGMEGGEGLQEMNEYDMDESAATVDFTEDTRNNSGEEDESNVVNSDAEDVTQEWPTTTTPSPLTNAEASSLGSAIDDVESESEDSVQAMELLEADDLDTIASIEATATLNGNRESEQSMGSERAGQAGDFDDRDIASAEMQSVGDSFVSAARKEKE